MIAFCRNLYHQLLVVNLICSHGYIFQFCENIYLLIILSLVGHSGRGVVAAACLGISFYLFFFSILEGVLQSLMFFMGEGKQLQKWITIAIFISLSISVLFLLSIMTARLLIFPLLSFKTTVVDRATWFGILLVPYLFLTGIRSVLIRHHDFLSRTRPIIVASVISSLSVLLGAIILIFSYPMGLLGCIIVMYVSQGISVVFLVASLGDTHSYKRSIKQAMKKLTVPICILRSTISSGTCFRSSKVDIAPVDENDSSAEGSSVTSTSLDVELTSISSRRRSSKKDLGATSAKKGLNTHKKESTSESDEESVESEDEDNEEHLLSSHNEDIQENHRNSYVGTKPSRFILSDFIKSIFRLLFASLPGISVLLAECSWYLVSIVIISSLGTYAVDSFFVQMSVVRFLVWSTIYPLSVATCIQLRAYLKSGHYSDCTSLVWLSFFQASLIGGIFSILLYFGQSYVWYWFSSNSSILHRCSDSAVFIAPYVFCYTWIIWAHGVMRAAGEVSTFLTLLLLANWVVGCPLSIYFSIFSRPVYNLMGYWIGWVTSGGLVAVSSVFYCLFILSWKKIYQRMKLKHRKRFQSSENPLHSERGSLLHSRNKDLTSHNDDQQTLSLLSDWELFGDISSLTIFNFGLGSFMVQSNSLEEDLLEIEIDLIENEV